MPQRYLDPVQLEGGELPGGRCAQLGREELGLDVSDREAQGVEDVVVGAEVWRSRRLDTTERSRRCNRKTRPSPNYRCVRRKEKAGRANIETSGTDRGLVAVDLIIGRLSVNHPLGSTEKNRRFHAGRTNKDELVGLGTDGTSRQT